MADVGLGVQAQGRFEVVQIDDAKISPDLKAFTGYVAALVRTHACTGAACFIPRKEIDRASTAFHIFIGLIKENGWFKILKSDSDPAYASSLNVSEHKQGLENWFILLLQLSGTKGGISHIRNALGSHSACTGAVCFIPRKEIDCASTAFHWFDQGKWLV